MFLSTILIFTFLCLEHVQKMRHLINEKLWRQRNFQKGWPFQELTWSCRKSFSGCDHPLKHFFPFWSILFLQLLHRYLKFKQTRDGILPLSSSALHVKEPALNKKQFNTLCMRKCSKVEISVLVGTFEN